MANIRIQSLQETTLVGHIILGIRCVTKDTINIDFTLFVEETVINVTSCDLTLDEGLKLEERKNTSESRAYAKTAKLGDKWMRY